MKKKSLKRYIIIKNLFFEKVYSISPIRFLQPANLVIMVKTALCCVCLIVRLVDTQMVCVLVRRVGWVIIAQ